MEFEIEYIFETIHSCIMDSSTDFSGLGAVQKLLSGPNTCCLCIQRPIDVIYICYIRCLQIGWMGWRHESNRLKMYIYRIRASTLHKQQCVQSANRSFQKEFTRKKSTTTKKKSKNVIFAERMKSYTHDVKERNEEEEEGKVWEPNTWLPRRFIEISWE